MFFIEMIVKYLKKDKFREILAEHDREESLNHLAEIPYEGDMIEPDTKNCEHIFMPIDSTGETLACTKCGELISRSELK